MNELLQTNITVILLDALGSDADLHLVGGAVRDFFLEKSPKDFDFATRLHPNEVIKRLDKKNISWAPTGIRRGTITAIIDHEPVEITTFRNYHDENTFTETIEEDLAARDFTVNAIAINCHNGNVVDPFGGLQHIKEKTIKAVGDGDLRFKEDPHRILRLVRFENKNGFQADLITRYDAINNVQLIKNIAQERIQDELIKILLLDDVKSAFEQLQTMGILKIILPELDACHGVEQNKHHRFDVFEHILTVVERLPKDKTLRLAGLFHDIAKPLTISVDENGERHFLEHEDVGAELVKEIMSRLRFSNDITDTVSLLVREHMRPITCGPKGVRRLLRAVDGHLTDWMQLKFADKLAGKFNEQQFRNQWEDFNELVQRELTREQEQPIKTLAIGGKELIELGLKPGPLFGVLLSHCEEAVIENPELNNKEALLDIVREQTNA